MAKVSLEAAIAAISGHTGTLQFSINPAGAMVSLKPRPATTPTTAQKQQRSAWSAMVTAWAKSTTTTQKKGWKDLADANPTPTKCGGSAALTNFQQFMATNRHLQKAGQSLKLAPPGTVATPSQGAITATYTPGMPPTIAISPTNAPTTVQVPIAWASGPSSAGQSQPTRSAKIIKIFPAGAPTPLDIGTEWESLYGQPTAGQAINVELQYVDFTTGAQTAKTRTKVIF